MTFYSIIYYFVYALVAKRNLDPKFYAASFVFLTQAIHVFFIATLIKVFVGQQMFPHFSDTYLFNKLFIMPFFAVWLILVHVWFEKRFSEIERYFKEKPIFSSNNIMLVIVSLILPLSLIIMMLKI